LIIIFIYVFCPYKLKYCDTNEGCFYELQEYLHYFNITFVVMLSSVLER